MEDKLLVIKCKRALARIYEKYKTDMLVLAMALLNDKSAAEDVMHDVFLSFVMNIEKFGLTGSLKGYLLTCLANRARNFNKAKHQQSVELDPAGPTGGNHAALSGWDDVQGYRQVARHIGQYRQEPVSIRTRQTEVDF